MSPSCFAVRVRNPPWDRPDRVDGAVKCPTRRAVKPIFLLKDTGFVERPPGARRRGLRRFGAARSARQEPVLTRHLGRAGRAAARAKRRSSARRNPPRRSRARSGKSLTGRKNVPSNSAKWMKRSAIVSRNDIEDKLPPRRPGARRGAAGEPGGAAAEDDGDADELEERDFPELHHMSLVPAAFEIGGADLLAGQKLRAGPRHGDDCRSPSHSRGRRGAARGRRSARRGRRSAPRGSGRGSPGRSA